MNIYKRYLDFFIYKTLTQKCRILLLLVGYLFLGNMSIAEGGVVTPSGEKAHAVHRGFFPSAAIPGPGYTVNIPLPDDAAPGTFVKLEGGVLFGWAGGGVGNDGDVVDNKDTWSNIYGWGQVKLGHTSNLIDLITPESTSASFIIDVSAQKLSSTSIKFSVDWSGSDAGTAQRILWYEYSGSSSGHEGNYTDLSNWDASSTLLHQELRVGPWSESFDLYITGINPDNIILVLDGVAASVPEPCTMAMLSLGGIAAIKRRRQ